VVSLSTTSIFLFHFKLSNSKSNIEEIEFSSTIPKYFLWIKYLSWFGYANEILVVNQWHGVTNIKCDTDISLCFVEGQNIIDYLNINTVNLRICFKLKAEFYLNNSLLGKLLLQLCNARLFDGRLENSVFYSSFDKIKEKIKNC